MPKDNPANAASKHAGNGTTGNAAVDHAPRGLRVHSVNLAATDTPMMARAGAPVAAQNAAAGPGAALGRPQTMSILAHAETGPRPQRWPNRSR